MASGAELCQGPSESMLGGLDASSRSIQLPRRSKTASMAATSKDVDIAVASHPIDLGPLCCPKRLHPSEVSALLRSSGRAFRSSIDCRFSAMNGDTSA